MTLKNAPVKRKKHPPRVDKKHPRADRRKWSTHRSGWHEERACAKCGRVGHLQQQCEEEGSERARDAGCCHPEEEGGVT